MQYDHWTPPGLGLVSGPEPTGRRIESEPYEVRAARRPVRNRDETDVLPLLKALVDEDPYFTARGGRNRQPQPWQRHDPQPAAGLTRQHTYVRSSIRRAS